MARSRLRKGIWLFAAGEFGEGRPSVRRWVERLAKGGFDLLLVCVKLPDGYLDYHTSVGLVRPLFAEKEDLLEVLCSEAHKHGLRIHPWYCVFRGGEGSSLLRRRKDLRALNREQNVDWSHEGTVGCTNRPEVQDYEFSLLREALDRYPVDGVHLDYIRTGATTCFCSYCQDWFRKETGGNLLKLPLNRGNEDYTRWCEWRAGNITKFVKRVHDEAHRKNKVVSAAVLSDYPYHIFTNGQDWGEWVRKRIIDYVIPMNYSPSTSLVEKYAEIHAAVVRKDAHLWEGLGTWHTREQTRAIQELGIEGAVFFQSKDKPLTDADLKWLAKIS
jgi:uncharacterized lipoprotein YddW (UPF0748 family)